MHKDNALSKKQIFYSRVVLGGVVVILGIFLLLCGVKAIPVPIIKSLPIALPIALGLICFIWAFIQDNTLMLWLSIPLFFVALVSLFCFLDRVRGYGFYYPFYIISPAMASLVTALYSKEWKDHLKVIFLFIPTAIIFALSSMINLPYTVTLPILIIFIGLYIISYALLRRKK